VWTGLKRYNLYIAVLNKSLIQSYTAVTFAIMVSHLTPESDIFSARCTSAKRGIEIACRPSVCDVGGSGSHMLEILETNCTDKIAQHLRSS